jgi:6-phosphogluconate dehydrogenase
MRTLTSRFTFLSWVLVVAVLPWLGRSGHAESASRGAEIKQVAYMYNVAEYCGLNTMEVYDGYRRERGPANLIQGQRDFFGAHTYERIDKPRGEFFHTNWTGRGGSTASTAYNA